MGLNTSFKVQLGRSDAVLYLAFDSVLNFTGDAIVNAANVECLGGGGIDGAVNALGGHVLKQARFALPLIGVTNVRCETGDAKITVAGGLPCSYVIHAVGPNFVYSETEHEVELQLLESAYKNSMDRAREKHIKSVGFCILSAGIYRGSCPLSVVIKTGRLAIARHAYPGLQTVVFCGFTSEERAVISDVAKTGGFSAVVSPSEEVPLHHRHRRPPVNQSAVTHLSRERKGVFCFYTLVTVSGSSPNSISYFFRTPLLDCPPKIARGVRGGGKGMDMDQVAWTDGTDTLECVYTQPSLSQQTRRAFTK